MADGDLDREVLTCPGCGTRYNVRLAGQGPSTTPACISTRCRCWPTARASGWLSPRWCPRDRPDRAAQVRPAAGRRSRAARCPGSAAQPARRPGSRAGGRRRARVSCRASAARRGQGQAEAPERCELCATEVPAEHGHIADLEGASLLCACRACYLLFTQRTAGRGRYRAVPDRYLRDPGRVMTPGRVGPAGDPRRPGLLPAHLARGRRPHRLLPESGGRDRVHARPPAVGAAGRRVSAARRAGRTMSRRR